MDIMAETVQKTKRGLVLDALKGAMSYEDYRLMVVNLALEGKSTGSMQSEELGNYSLLNNQRMKRLDKTIKIDADSESKIKEVDQKIT